MNLMNEIEQTVAPHIVDQIFGAGTMEKMPAILTQVGQARLDDDKGTGTPTSQEEMTTLLEQEAQDFEPTLNAKIDAWAKEKAFGGSAILAFLEAEGLKELVPAETALIKSFVPGVVAELYKVVPAPIISIASEIAAQQEAKNFPLDGASFQTAGATGNLGTQGEAVTNNPTDNPA